MLNNKHFKALLYVLTKILPIIFKTGKKPLILSKWSGIGDIICTMPAALELAKKYKGAPIIYNCYEKFNCIPRVAGLTTLTSECKEIGLVGHWFRWLLAGFYQFTSDDDRPNLQPQDVYIKDFGKSSGVSVTGEHPSLHCSGKLTEVLRQRLIDSGIIDSPLILIHLGPTWPVREWPLESWNTLVDELHDSRWKNIIQIGTSVNTLTSGAKTLKLVRNCLSFVDLLNLEESIALISIADIFVGIDSGMLHIAASVGTPSIGIWGPTSPEFRFFESNRKLHISSSVECKGCHHRVPREHWISGCPHDIRCMRLISPKDVFMRIDQFLKTKFAP